MKAQKGFTLVELMISMGVTMVLMGAVYMSVNATQRNSSAIEGKVTAQQDVKPVLDLMAMEIGMASYNPNSAPAAGLWVVAPTAGASGACVADGIAAYRGIQEATPTSITVEMDICGTGPAPDSIVGTVGSGGKNEIIRYSYDTVNQYITRSTNCGGNQPFLGDVPANTRAVRVINNTLGLPVFRYYDGTGADISAGLPAVIPNIRRIAITLAVETENVDPNTNLRRKLIYSTSVIPRNHAIQ
jgi:prepilin-type N-terminal cleavage/methylation domain-containing protein